jgi:hypothetical protein
MGKLYTRGKYLGIKRDTHELFWNISVLLLKEFKNLRKGSVNPFPIGTVKEKSRDEREFRAFRAGSYLFDNILSISNLRIFRSSRLPKSRNFFIIVRYYLRRRDIFA